MAFEVESSLEDEEREGGACPICFRPAQRVECWQCCDAVWMIDCQHRSQPPPMRHGRRDGSEPHRIFCSDCSDPI